MPMLLGARALARASVLALAGSLGHDAQAAEPGEVNVYSYRQPYLIDPLFKKFTDETGIKVNVIFAEKGLIERIAGRRAQQPGRSPAHRRCRQSDAGDGGRHRASRSNSQELEADDPGRPIATPTASGSGSPAAPASSTPRRSG